LLGLSTPMVRRRTRARKKRTVYPALNAAPAKRSGAWLMLVLGALVVVNLYVFVWDKKTGVRAIKQQAEAHTGPSMTIPSAPLPTAPADAAASVPVPVAPATPPRAEGANWEKMTGGGYAATGKVAKADTLGKLLKKSGLTAAESDEIIRALSGVLDFRAIRAGQAFRIERAPDGRVKRFELDLSKGHKVSAERQPSGELRAEST
jgi:hypothetical protein